MNLSMICCSRGISASCLGPRYRPLGEQVQEVRRMLTGLIQSIKLDPRAGNSNEIGAETARRAAKDGGWKLATGELAN